MSLSAPGMFFYKSFVIKILLFMGVFFHIFEHANSQFAATDSLNSNLAAATTSHVFTFVATSYSVVSGTYI